MEEDPWALLSPEPPNFQKIDQSGPRYLDLEMAREMAEKMVDNMLAKVAKVATDELRSNDDEPHAHFKWRPFCNPRLRHLVNAPNIHRQQN